MAAQSFLSQGIGLELAQWQPRFHVGRQTEDLSSGRCGLLRGHLWRPPQPSFSPRRKSAEVSLASLGARRDRGRVRRALRPGTQVEAGKAATPSPVKHRMFVGNLVLNHSWMICFWVGVSYVAEQLPHFNLF